MHGNAYELRLNGKDTLSEWHCICGLFEVSGLTYKDYRVSVPGMHGTHDLTEAYGGVFLEDRQITVQLGFDPKSSFDSYVDKFEDDIVGKRIKIWSEKEPGHHFEGRGSVTERSNDGIPTITVVFIVDPKPISGRA